MLPGNKDYVAGDRIKRPPGGAGGGGSGGNTEGEGEDAFRFVLTREEFLDLFLDDLELPDLAKRRLAETEHEGVRRAGYTSTGSPSSLAVTRSMRQAMARRVALRRPTAAEVEGLDAELAAATDDDERAAIGVRIEALGSRLRRIPYIDPVDLRFRRFETYKKPVAQAVMFCLMDVSGSMSEHMKDLAKRFFTLLYLFLSRRYRRVEIVFIRHTHEAEEVDEETFFRSPATGGTIVSSALAEMQRIVAAALPSRGLEHLRGPGVRRRQLALRRGRDDPPDEGRHPARHAVLRLCRARRGPRRGAVRRPARPPCGRPTTRSSSKTSPWPCAG